ncbi:MAG: hypothetical protein C1O27_000375 [Chloroflexi bacterium]|jgi:hypothetical protein|nr:MAG: hypothetical protein C1O27_000375 [Chloroflexota bacterium]
MVIVDTSVWIQFMRARNSLEHLELARLIRAGQAVMVGPVLAEILQGARSQEEYERLFFDLTALPYAETSRETWAEVGLLSYQLRREGSPVGVVDLTIAALALEYGHGVYTLDKHFLRIPGLLLHRAEL